MRSLRTTTAQEFHRPRPHRPRGRLVYLSDRRSQPLLAFQSHEFRRRSRDRTALRRSGGEMFGVDHRDRSGDRNPGYESREDPRGPAGPAGADGKLERDLAVAGSGGVLRSGRRSSSTPGCWGMPPPPRRSVIFLEQHRETLMVDDGSLRALRRLRPRGPHYLDRGHVRAQPPGEGIGSLTEFRRKFLDRILGRAFVRFSESAICVGGTRHRVSARKCWRQPRRGGHGFPGGAVSRNVEYLHYECIIWTCE